jgi:S-adenosylmethionine:tRNA ribosyltransferase-isomerase
MFDLIPPEYYYELPGDRIAQFPLSGRDSSKLLVYKNGKIESSVFKDIGGFLRTGSLLVFNNTRVIRARLIFFKESGARIEIFCLEPIQPAEYSQMFASRSPVEWICLAGNQKKWKEGELKAKISTSSGEIVLSAAKVSRDEETVRIRFSWSPSDLSFGEVIERAGHIPLPPYIGREDVPSDALAYQTVYASVKGSVAAPTAGLHFTENLLNKLGGLGIARAELTLHVGAGTFQPLKSDRISEHSMHAEHFSASRELIETLINNQGKILAVGTTSVRTLESLYWLGVKQCLSEPGSSGELFTDQWEPYKIKSKIPVAEALGALLALMDNAGTDHIKASTRIIIVPGYRFMVTDGIITNFHQPGSTLLLLVSAFIGEDWKKVYRYALDNGFRFLSYGDSSLLLRL